MTLYLIAGEASGDARGAELIRALKERKADLKFIGAGGVKMQNMTGDHIHNWTDEAVIGLWDVLKKYGYFKRQFNRMLRDIVQEKPDALILIDYPGFNLRIAAAARKLMPSMKIIYYISPQVWAWNQGRIPKMATYLDLMLCLFPFEIPLYEKSGLKAVCVGHPLIETLAAKKQPLTRDPNLVVLLPGSREREVRKIFPDMLEAARALKQARPETRFETAAASPAIADVMEEILLSDSDESLCTMTLGNAYELMQRGAAGMVCSGTATLEATYFGLPMVILYKVAWLTWFAASRLVKIPHIGLPNVLAGREIIPEFIQHDIHPDAITEKLLALLQHPETRDKMQSEQAAVIASLGEPGAAGRAAAAIAETLKL